MTGVVRLLKKEQDRLPRELRGIGAALAAFGNAYGKGTGKRKLSASARGADRGCPKSALGKGSRKRWQICQGCSSAWQTHALGSSPQEDCRRSKDAVGMGQGGKENGISEDSTLGRLFGSSVKGSFLNFGVLPHFRCRSIRRRGVQVIDSTAASLDGAALESCLFTFWSEDGASHCVSISCGLFEVRGVQRD